MKIYGLNKTTLLDYPGRVAATIFLGGCNFRCPFCQNSGLVLNPSSQPELSVEEVLSFLKKRRGILEGVCVTGGEPTLSPDLPEFLAEIRALGYPIKLDTNGTRDRRRTFYERSHPAGKKSLGSERGSYRMCNCIRWKNHCQRIQPEKYR